MAGWARGASSECETSDERELVRRAQRGDAAAFGVLVVRHQDTIYRLAARTVGHDAAEDLALLALRVGEEWSYERIATELHLNIKTVGTRLFRARAKLHRLVSQQLRERGRDES